MRLTKEKCRDVQDGGETWGLRISKIPAAEERKKEITEDKIDAVVKWAREKGKTLADIEETYVMSDAVRIALSEQLDDLPE